MKIERLNENSIRCTLNRADLDSRELKISELAYGTEKAKSLFKDMIAQASFECGFEAEDIPLMIEAIPVSPDCIVLVITKVEDPEELDTRFSKFAPSEDDADDYEDMLDGEDDEDESKNYVNPSELLNKINDALNDDDDFIPFSDMLAKNQKSPASNDSRKAEISYDSEPAQDVSDVSSSDADSAEDENIRIEKLFSFADLNHVSSAASAVSSQFTGGSILFKNPGTNRYYLLINNDEMRPDSFTGICNVLTEYGRREKFSYATLSYLQEHYDLIIGQNAVSVLAQI